MNINDKDFFATFDKSQAVVGLFGHGYIGQAVEALFKNDFQVLVHDPAKELDSKERVVSESHVIFVAVPTPMNPDGSCHTGIVEAVLQDIQNSAVRVGRDVEEFVVVLKSTVPPGFTKRMNEKFALRIVFSPEFLTEKNSVEDFVKATRVILGGDIDDSAVVFKFFETVWPSRIAESYDGHPDGPVHVLGCDSTVAEVVKYFTNCYLSTVVTFANEFKSICDLLGSDYDLVTQLAVLDPRISTSHLKVPGPDGRRGFGGSCFPKDVNSIRHVCKELGTGERLFTAVVERNDEFRPERDWLELKGRAVVDE
jgi:UDPglucose 6-dehydrogenase